VEKCTVLGEISDMRELGASLTIEVFEQAPREHGHCRCFPRSMRRLLPVGRVLARSDTMAWLHFDRFWAEQLPASRKRPRWDQVLVVLVDPSPGSAAALAFWKSGADGL
jgi:hypothetical protein